MPQTDTKYLLMFFVFNYIRKQASIYISIQAVESANFLRVKKKWPKCSFATVVKLASTY